jgi:hypothetical protein
MSRAEPQPNSEPPAAKLVIGTQGTAHPRGYPSILTRTKRGDVSRGNLVRAVSRWELLHEDWRPSVDSNQ